MSYKPIACGTVYKGCIYEEEGIVKTFRNGFSESTGNHAMIVGHGGSDNCANERGYA